MMEHTIVKEINLASHQESTKALEGFFTSTLNRKPVCRWAKWLWTENIWVSEHWLWLSQRNPSEIPAAHRGCCATAMAGHHVANDAKNLHKVLQSQWRPHALLWSHFASCRLISLVSSIGFGHRHLHSKNYSMEEEKKKRQSLDTKHAFSHSANAQ